MSASSEQHWHDNPAFRKAFWITAAVVILVAIGMSAHALYKPLRAEQLASQALEALADGDLVKAQMEAGEARDMAPGSLTVARSFAKVWNEIAPTQVAPLWEHMAELSGATQDKQSWALALIAAGEMSRAKDILSGLLKTAPGDPQTLYVEVNYLMAAARPAVAYAKAIELVSNNGGEEKYWVVYRAVALRQGAEGRAAYLKQLENLKSHQGRLGLWALEQLAELSPVDELDARIDKLLRHPLSTRQTLLLSFALRHRRAGMPYADIREKVERVFNKADDADRQALARFYQSIGDYTGVLSIVTPEVAVSDKIDLGLYLGGLSATKHWDTLLGILNFDKLPIENWQRELLKANAYAGLGKDAEARAALDKAVASAGADTRELAEIAHYLVVTKNIAELEKVMPILIKSSGTLEHPLYYQLWLEAAITARDTDKILAIYEKMSAESPDNQAFKNSRIYYSLLAKKPGDWLKESYDLVKAGPGIVSSRITLGLALLRAGQNGRAYEIINSARVSDWTTMPTGWQLVRAAALKMNGKTVPAVVDADKALKEEQELAK